MQQKIYILGICGTFMGGLALLARELGYEVAGCDRNVYPPMSTQLEEAGIALDEGFDPARLPADATIVVGNGACCDYLRAHCEPWVEEAECMISGDWYFGDGIACEDVDCPPLIGACCDLDGSCIDGILQEDCEAIPGLFQGVLTECSTVTCPPPTGACCLPSGQCIVSVGLARPKKSE